MVQIFKGKLNVKAIVLLIGITTLIINSLAHADLRSTIKIYILKIVSETVATTPSDRSRTTIGIGEEVIWSQCFF